MRPARSIVPVLPPNPASALAAPDGRSSAATRVRFAFVPAVFEAVLAIAVSLTPQRPAGVSANRSSRLPSCLASAEPDGRSSPEEDDHDAANELGKLDGPLSRRYVT